MLEDWQKWLTEEQRWAVQALRTSDLPLAKVWGFLRSLAASHALVAAKDKRLRRRSEDWHDEMKHKGEWIECTILTCSVDREALALTEQDMLNEPVVVKGE